MNEKWKKRFLLSLAFGAVVFLGLTLYADADELLDALTRFHWGFLPLILLCTLLNYGFRYAKWEYYTLTLQCAPSRERNVIIFFTAFIMAVTPGKFGEILKSYLLKQVNGTPVRKSAPIILAERLTDFIGLVVLLIAGAYVFGYAQSLIIGFSVFFFGITGVLSWRKGSLALVHLLRHVFFVKKYVDHAVIAYESIYSLLRPRPLFIGSLLSIVAWFFECLGFWIVLSVFQAPPTLMKATFIYAFATIVGAVTMLPGGLGTTEGSLTGLTILAGAPKDIAVASTLIIRFATLWFAVLIGIVVTFTLQKRLNIRLDELPLDEPVLGSPQ